MRNTEIGGRYKVVPMQFLRSCARHLFVLCRSSLCSILVSRSTRFVVLVLLFSLLKFSLRDTSSVHRFLAVTQVQFFDEDSSVSCVGQCIHIAVK